MTDRLDRPVSDLPGVGKVKSALLAKLGITTVRELVETLPRAYQDRGKITLLEDADPEKTSSFLLTVGTVPTSSRTKTGKICTKFFAHDGYRKAEIRFYNQKYLEDTFVLEETFRFFGKPKFFGRKITFDSPQFDFYDENNPPPALVPVYPLTAGLSGKTLRRLLADVIASFTKDGVCYLPETLPAYLCREEGLISRGEAIRSIHFPNGEEELAKARKRIFFEQMLFFSLGVASSRRKMEQDAGRAFPMEKPLRQPFLDLIGFKLTNAQIRSIGEIVKDMTNPGRRPMTRLLSGDVGSGKTVVAAYAAYVALANGRQVALMAPTEILAAQHFRDLSSLFEKLGYSVALLTGSLRASEKKAIHERMRLGEVGLVIGTHALLSEGAVFSSLGLVITDEQHRFGYAQRAGLVSHGRSDFVPHILTMSATPIPRTMALILYGDMDLSRLDELPPGRQRVETFLVDESYRSRMEGFIRKQVQEGGQVYIVCPAVETDGDDEEEGDYLDESGTGQPMPLKAAVTYAEKLQNEIFPEYKIGFVHGRMPPKDKDRVMTAFAANEIQILVSTTVIEVGVNVPNATLMIVENAERFGLSQLHQLRGRVGRGQKKAYCILVSDSRSERTRERLSVMKSTFDGYAIAEKDLAQRGPGDFLPGMGGVMRQHGESGFSFSPVGADAALMQKAVSRAKEILAADPDLVQEKNELLRRHVEEMFRENVNA